MKPKNNFVDTLKHGKCSGRKQLHNARIHPEYCVKENAGTELHGCPDLDTFFINTESKCNCCEDCHDVCYQAHLVRSQNTMKDIYEQWKEVLKKHDE